LAENSKLDFTLGDVELFQPFLEERSIHGVAKSQKSCFKRGSDSKIGDELGNFLTEL